MAEIDWSGKRASVFWGTALAAARDHQTTAQYWDALRAQAAQLGFESPQIGAIEAGQLRGLAGRWQRSQDALQSSNHDTAITGDMISTAPYSRDLASRNAFASFEVRFAHTTSIDGEESTDYRTVMFDGQLPYTVADLHAAVESDAEQLADEYETEHVGISDLSITAV